MVKITIRTLSGVPKTIVDLNIVNFDIRELLCMYFIDRGKFKEESTINILEIRKITGSRDGKNVCVYNWYVTLRRAKSDISYVEMYLSYTRNMYLTRSEL